MPPLISLTTTPLQKSNPFGPRAPRSYHFARTFCVLLSAPSNLTHTQPTNYCHLVMSSCHRHTVMSSCHTQSVVSFSSINRLHLSAASHTSAVSHLISFSCIYPALPHQLFLLAVPIVLSSSYSAVHSHLYKLNTRLNG